MLLMMGRKMTVMMVKGKNNLLLTHTSLMKWKTVSQLLETHSQSANNRVTPPLPLSPSRRPAPGKRMCYGPKKDAVEDKLLQIIEKLEKKLDEDEMFCHGLAATLRKIHDPQKKDYAKLQLQQTVYNCSVWFSC